MIFWIAFGVLFSYLFLFKFSCGPLVWLLHCPSQCSQWKSSSRHRYCSLTALTALHHFPLDISFNRRKAATQRVNWLINWRIFIFTTTILNRLLFINQKMTQKNSTGIDAIDFKMAPIAKWRHLEAPGDETANCAMPPPGGRHHETERQTDSAKT